MFEADPRDEVMLEMLADASGGIVSGEIVSGKLGLEPSEVFRRVNGLRARGYRIDSVPGGYRLVSVPDMVGPLEVGTFLTTQEFGRTLHYRETLPSTNEVAFRLAQEGAFHGDVVVAEHQSQGRGRPGRRWLSPSRSNLTFSVVLRPDLPVARAPELTFVTAVALAGTIKEAFDLKVRIKWPNDLLIGERKVAGILPEVHGDGEQVRFVILGVGVNVNMSEQDMPEEIAKIATSMSMETGEVVSRPLLLAALLSSLEGWYGRWLEEGFGPVREEWLAENVTLGRQVRVVSARGTELTGVAEDIAEDGALLVRTLDGGLERVYGGEVLDSRG